MSEIKLISEKSNLKKLHKLDWDVNVNGKLYDLYLIPGYIHTIGGKYGDNEYWACPIGEEPSYLNLIQFDGFPVRWSFSIKENNSIKSKWDETEIRSNVSCTIMRNDEEFYSFSSADIAYACAKAQVLITELNDHPIPFSLRNYEKEIIGRKILYHDEPAIITSYIKGQACIIIEFTEDANKDHIIKSCYCETIDNKLWLKDEIFSKQIWWWETR